MEGPIQAIFRISHDRGLNRRNLVQESHTSCSLLRCCLAVWQPLENLQVPSSRFCMRSLEPPLTSPSLPWKGLPTLLSSLISRLPRHRGCPDLASLTPRCGQRHRQPLGCVSPPVSRGWQAPGPHPTLPAAGTWDWPWDVGQGQEGR